MSDDRGVKRFNLLHGELNEGFDRDGYRRRWEQVGPIVGGERIGLSVYELPAGERTFPYHFHHGVEEWLLVLDGSPTLRDPEGERTLRRGDVVCFPSGPEGAHAVTGPGRIALLSAGGSPSVTVYPDSDKIGARPGVQDETLNFRRADAVDYWAGE